MQYYYAYGSNLNLKQMTTRCPSAQVISIAKLNDYVVIFPRKHRNWPAGVASVEAKVASMVEGVIYSISDADLLALDEAENLSANEYFREEMVFNVDGKTQKAWVYIANEMPDAPYLPDQTYMTRIIDGAKEHGLSDAYIEYLKSIEICNTAS